MTNQLINAAAFIAAIATVVFERFVAPTFELIYRYILTELGADPTLMPSVAVMPVAVAPEPAIVKPEAKPAPKRRTTRKKTTATKPAAGTGF